MIDHGSGIPIVLVPGIQGRWEWMQQAVDALATQNRVITDSLLSEPGSIASINTKRGFGRFIDWLDQLLARANVDAVNAFTKLATTISYRALSAGATTNGTSICSLLTIQALPRNCSSISVSPKKIALRGRVPSTCRIITSNTNANG